MAERPKDFPELIARLVDTNDDGDPQNPLTASLVESLSKCDLIIGGVLRYITDEQTIHDDGFWWGCYARTDTVETLIGEAQRRLADLFGGAYIEGLQERLNAAVRSRHQADDDRRKTWSKQWDAERVRDGLVSALEHVARSATDGYAQEHVAEALEAAKKAQSEYPADVPDLLAEIETLRAENARLKAQADRDTAAMDAETDRSSREAQDLRDARDDALRAEEGMYRGCGNR